MLEEKSSIKIMKRSAIREAAFKLIYSFEIQKPENLEEQIDLYLECEEITDKEAKEYLKTVSGVSLGSDAFFPFDDNIERARRSGVSYIVEPGGSIRDDIVIDCCNKHGITMAFTGIRLFHH